MGIDDDNSQVINAVLESDGDYNVTITGVHDLMAQAI